MKEKLMGSIIAIVIIIIVLICSKWIITAIINSDMPDWLKILLLLN